MSIPYSLQGPTDEEVEQFKREHPDAKTCPKCGYKYLVEITGISEAYVDGFCFVCGETKTRRSRLSKPKAKEE